MNLRVAGKTLNSITISQNDSRFLNLILKRPKDPRLLAADNVNFSQIELTKMGLYGNVIEYPLAVALTKRNLLSEFDGVETAFTLICWTGRSVSEFAEGSVNHLKSFSNVISSKIDMINRSDLNDRIHLRYRNALDLLPVFVFQKDSRGVFQIVNKALARAMATNSPEEIEGKTDFDFFETEIAEKYQQDDQRVMSEKVTLSWYEKFLPRLSDPKDSKILFVTKTPILGPANPFWPKDESRTAIGIIGVCIEIPDAFLIWECTEGGAILWSNQVFRTMFRSSGGEATSIFSFMDKANSRRFKAILKTWKSVSKSARSNRLLRLSLPKGVISKNEADLDRILEVVDIITSEGSRERGGPEFRVLARDVTENERFEQKIRQQNWKAVLPGLLALGIAHGLKHLIGLVKFKERIVKRSLRNYDHLISDSLINDIADIVETVNLLKSPVDELMELRGAQDDLEKLNLLGRQANVVVNLLKRALDGIPDGKASFVDFSGVSESHCIEVHGTLISEVFHSLLVNAIRHCPRKLIRVSSFEMGNLINLDFADSGSGIPEELLEAIFEPFFTTCPTEGGNGIGLAFARAVVENLHGGKITARNSPNGGAVFSVALPIGRI